MERRDRLWLRDTAPGEDRIGGRSLTYWGTAGGRWLVGRMVALARVVTANGVLAVTAAVGMVLVVGLVLAAGGIYDAVEESDGLAGLDRPVLDGALAARSPGLDAGLTFFTHLGGPLGMTVIAATITAAMVWRWRSRTPLVLMLITVAGSLLATVSGKNAVGRLRPPQADAVPPYESSPSFPSGHALNSTAIAGMVAYLLVMHLHRRLARVLAITVAGVWAVAIGLSRVFLGHHWLTDVMVGWTIGLAWLAVVVTAHRLYLSVRGQERSPRPPARR